MADVLDAQAGAPAAPAPAPAAPVGKAPAAPGPGTGGAPAEPKGSIYDAVGVDEPGKPDSSTWPSDWRASMAGGDEKAAKALERYQSPDAVAKALLEARKRIGSGEYARQITPDSPPEEVAKWREEQGIPAEPAGYDLLGSADKYEALDDFGREGIDLMRSTFHDLNIRPEQARTIMEAAQQLTEKQQEATYRADAERQVAVEETLRGEWGADYRRNIALNSQHLASKFGDDWQSIITARMPDGSRLADSPVFNKAINDWARAEGGTVLVGGEVVSGVNNQSRIGEIEKIMRSDWSKYKRDGLDKEYEQLLNARR